MRPDRLYLEDILAASDSIAEFVRGLDPASFEANDVVRSAVLFKLMVIGEAPGKLSRELRQQHGDMPWSDIIGLRNLVVHAYFGVDWEIVWTTAAQDVPPLRDRVAAILTATNPST